VRRGEKKEKGGGPCSCEVKRASYTDIQEKATTHDNGGGGVEKGCSKLRENRVAPKTLPMGMNIPGGREGELGGREREKKKMIRTWGSKKSKSNRRKEGPHKKGGGRKNPGLRNREEKKNCVCRKRKFFFYGSHEQKGRSSRERGKGWDFMTSPKKKTFPSTIVRLGVGGGKGGRERSFRIERGGSFGQKGPQGKGGKRGGLSDSNKRGGAIVI